MDIPKIESNIPIPEAQRGRIRKKYPFQEMQVGDSFLVPVTDVEGKWNASKMNNRITSAARQYQQQNNPLFRVICRKVEGGVRCWRIDDAKEQV